MTNLEWLKGVIATTNFKWIEWIKNLPEEELIRELYAVYNKEWLNAEHKEEIKPCPFCGGKPFVNKDSVHYWVSCSCGVHGTYGTKREQAIEAWNRRAGIENA